MQGRLTFRPLFVKLISFFEDCCSQARLYLVRSSGSTIGTSTRTDADGFFTRYVSSAGSYKVTARFQELIATSEQFTLDDGEHREDLVLTFDSEPIPRSEEW